MKAKTISLVMLLVSICTTYVYADAHDASEEDFPVVADQYPNPIRRTPSRTPIIGVYSNGYLELVFRADLGIVDCIIENTETLETWTASFDSEEGSTIIDVSETPGTYSVLLRTKFGTYRSSYVIN